MKKTRMKLISVVLIISMMSGILLIHSSANEVEYDKIAHNYFEQLGNKIPNNIHGSCGYVAMSMLLSFYDIYWNNTFVDDKYMDPLQPSVGLYSDYPGNVPTLLLEKNDKAFPNIDSTQDDDNTIESEPTKTDEELENEYRAFIADKSGDYFHMYLLSLGIQSGLHPTDDDELGFGITVNEMAVLLDGYLDSKFGQADYYRTDQNYGSNAKITIHTVSENKNGKTRNDVINAIKTQVGSGNPVIYGADRISSDATSRSSDTGNNKDKEGHFMVAYHQTDSDIWFHNGQFNNDEGQTELFSTTTYNLGIEAIWIEINENLLPHSCSYRYKYNKTNGSEAVCSCNAYKNHPAHIHRVCEYESTSNSSDTHIYNCYCSSFEEAHLYDSYKNLGTSEHRIYCDCGASITAEHSYYRYSSFGASGHRIYCNCGDYIFESHPSNAKRCNLCGYFDDTYYQPWQNPDDPKDELLE